MSNAATCSVREIDILIAEDSPTQALQLDYCLATQGYSVTIARDGRQALAVALQNKPALIITDIVMPEMDGYEFCRAVKAHEKLKDVPVILLTSLSAPQDVLKGLECGADSFVRKPYQDSDLLSRIEFVLTNRELRKTERLQTGVQLHFGGKAHFITAEKQQILDLLISTYQNAVQINQELQGKQLELENANRELEAFSYSVSHDLRAPLRHISGFAGMLSEEHGSELGTKAKDLILRIEERAATMASMIDSLLNLARLDRHELTPQVTPLKPLVERLITDLGSETIGRRIEWRIGDLPCAACDPILIRQVFANLLSNALKYTSRKELAVIEVDLTAKNGQKVIFVRDNGAGFDVKHASRLFGAFQRLHSAEEFAGVGVGLATVQRIIRRHGGQIWAEGEVQRGATFYFTLENLVSTSIADR